jgi:hypothetical protein
VNIEGLVAGIRYAAQYRESLKGRELELATAISGCSIVFAARHVASRLLGEELLEENEWEDFRVNTRDDLTWLVKCGVLRKVSRGVMWNEYSVNEEFTVPAK